MSHNRRLHGLDFLRALAIVLVFFVHYSKQFAHPAFLEPITEQWWAGVDLFFVLSGFLIASAIFRELKQMQDFSYKTFYIKRTFRIFPPYFFILALYAFLPGLRESDTIAPFWKFITFTQNIGLDVNVQRTFSHAWSLCMEEQFYLIFPSIALLLYRGKGAHRLGWVLVGLVLAGIVSRFVTAKSFVHDFDSFMIWIYYAPHSRFDGLVFGVLIAWIYEFKPQWRAWFELRWRAVGIVGLLWMVTLFYFNPLQGSLPFTLFYFPSISLAFGLLVISMVSGRWIISTRPIPVIRFLADISYSGYLSHKMVIHLVQTQGAKFGLAETGIGMLACCTIASVICASAMFLLIEKPSFACRDRLLGVARKRGTSCRSRH